MKYKVTFMTSYGYVEVYVNGATYKECFDKVMANPPKDAKDLTKGHWEQIG